MFCNYTYIYFTKIRLRTLPFSVFLWWIMMVYWTAIREKPDIPMTITGIMTQMCRRSILKPVLSGCILTGIMYSVASTFILHGICTSKMIRFLLYKNHLPSSHVLIALACCWKRIAPRTRFVISTGMILHQTENGIELTAAALPTIFLKRVGSLWDLLWKRVTLASSEKAVTLGHCFASALREYLIS